ncbi:MAG: hypothetical protein RID93_10445, partial [Sandaracinaceae bacterium]
MPYWSEPRAALRLSLVVAFSLGAVLGCDGAPAMPDAGPADGGPADSGPGDSGPGDSGPVDAGPPPATIECVSPEIGDAVELVEGASVNVSVRVIGADAVRLNDVEVTPDADDLVELALDVRFGVNTVRVEATTGEVTQEQLCTFLAAPRFQPADSVLEGAVHARFEQDTLSGEGTPGGGVTNIAEAIDVTVANALGANGFRFTLPTPYIPVDVSTYCGSCFDAVDGLEILGPVSVT